MTAIQIALNMGTVTEAQERQIAESIGLPESLRDRTLWVQTYFHTVDAGESFPVDKWVNSVPGQSAELGFEQLGEFCDELRSATDDEGEAAEVDKLRERLLSIVNSVDSEARAHFSITFGH